jgi:hypothetical protein
MFLEGGIMPTYAWVSPTGHIEPTGEWVNPANVYDGNWDTYAYNVTVHDGWTVFIVLTLTGNMWIDRIRFKYNECVLDKKIDIDVYDVNAGVWVNEVESIYEYGVKHEAAIPMIYTDRVRVRIEGSPTDYLHEIDVEQVIPDTPPPPPPPNAPEVYRETKKEQKGQPVLLHTARDRVVHRVTVIKPWVV